MIKRYDTPAAATLEDTHMDGIASHMYDGLTDEEGDKREDEIKDRSDSMFEECLGNPDLYQAMAAKFRQEVEGETQGLAMNRAFGDMSLAFDGAAAFLEQADNAMAGALVAAIDLREAISRDPEPGVHVRDFEAAQCHIEAAAIMVGGLGRLRRFIDFWTDVPVMHEEWDDFREEAARLLTLYR